MLRDNFVSIVGQANAAPNVHNIQPARWRLEGDAVMLRADPARTLPAGDPHGKDIAISLGAAAEGAALALSAMGGSLQPIDSQGAGRPDASHRLTAGGGGDPDPLSSAVSSRTTWRGTFAKASPGNASALTRIAEADDVILASEPEDIETLARLNDEASLSFFRNRDYRRELRSWMRFTAGHPEWSRDGLNARAMAMNGFEARAAGVVLSDGVFDWLDRLHLARFMISELQKTMSASAIILFHRSVDEDYFAVGRRFYRLWLEITRAGLAACPMAVLADHEDIAAQVMKRFGVPGDRRLITAFRVGVVCKAAAPRVRLPVAETILPS